MHCQHRSLFILQLWLHPQQWCVLQRRLVDGQTCVIVFLMFFDLDCRAGSFTSLCPSSSGTFANCNSRSLTKVPCEIPANADTLYVMMTIDRKVVCAHSTHWPRYLNNNNLAALPLGVFDRLKVLTVMFVAMLNDGNAGIWWVPHRHWCSRFLGNVVTALEPGIFDQMTELTFLFVMWA